VDSQGQVWVVGAADPVSPVMACGGSLGCGTASGVRKLDANRAKLLVSKTFGGGPFERFSQGRLDAALGVAVDGNDSVWVVGTAESSDVPTTPGTLEPTLPVDPGHDGI
jgi:hypothetical protein